MFNRKRKRNSLTEELPPNKRFKSSSPDKQNLYINDRNTTALNISRLNVDSKTVKTILSEVRKKPFKSADDIIQRVNKVTKQSIHNVNLIFETRFQEQHQLIYNALSNIPWIKQICNEPNILEIIATQSIGKIEKCHTKNCNEPILLINHDELYYPPTNSLFLSDEKKYLFNEYTHPNIYYYRKHKLLGNAIYCNKCCKNLKHCPSCHKRIYFIHQRKSYNICSGLHLYQPQKKSIDNDDDPVIFQFKICKQCVTCYHHTLSPNALLTHKHEDRDVEFQ